MTRPERARDFRGTLRRLLGRLRPRAGAPGRRIRLQRDIGPTVGDGVIALRELSSAPELPFATMPAA
jgi:hypothetical protein